MKVVHHAVAGGKGGVHGDAQAGGVFWWGVAEGGFEPEHVRDSTAW